MLSPLSRLGNAERRSDQLSALVAQIHGESRISFRSPDSAGILSCKRGNCPFCVTIYQDIRLVSVSTFDALHGSGSTRITLLTLNSPLPPHAFLDNRWGVPSLNSGADI